MVLSTAGSGGSAAWRWIRIWMCWPSGRGSRSPCTRLFERTSTACSASFGPIARAASSPVAPSGSSSSDWSGRTTFMSNQDMEQPREDDRNDELDESPVPDPEKDTDADDVPEAD